MPTHMLELSFNIGFTSPVKQAYLENHWQSLDPWLIRSGILPKKYVPISKVCHCVSVYQSLSHVLGRNMCVNSSSLYVKTQRLNQSPLWLLDIPFHESPFPKATEKKSLTLISHDLLVENLNAFFLYQLAPRN